MGTIFCRDMMRRGYLVDGYDISAVARDRAANHCKRVLEELEGVDGYDVIVAAVPISESPKVARRLAGALREGSAYVDVTSIKRPVNTVLREVVSKATLVSLHPLFGPGATGVEGRVIVLTPINDERGEMEVAEKLFEGSKIIVMDEDRHDRAVAYSITLPQLLGYLHRGISGGEVVLPTTSGRLQALASAVEADDPPLAAEIACANDGYSIEIVERAAALISKVLGVLRGRDVVALAGLLEEMKGEWTEWSSLYDEAYELLDGGNP